MRLIRAAFAVTLAALSITSVSPPAGGVPRAFQPEWNPWQQVGSCSQVELSLAQSRSTAGGGARRVRLRAKNLNGFAVELSITPRVKTDGGQEISLPTATVRLEPNAEADPANAVWEVSVPTPTPTPTPTSPPAPTPMLASIRIVAWGFEKVEVRRVGSTSVLANCPIRVAPTTPAAIAEILGALGNVLPGGAEVPATARGLLSNLKDRLRELVVAVVNQGGDTAVSPALLRARVVELLGAEGVAVGDVANGPAFGALKDLQIATVQGHPDFLALTFKFGLPVGDDTSLTLVRRDAGSWRPAIVVEARDYAKLTEAQSALTYALSPTAPAQGVFAVIADVTPPAPSGARAIRRRIYAPANVPAGFALVEDGTESYCGDAGTAPAFDLSSAQDGVIIRYSDGSSAASIAHQPVVKYAFVGDSVKKVMTLEESARGFVEEWIGLDPSPAARWIEQIAPEIVACRRDELRKANFRPTAPGSAARVCPADSCQVQIESVRTDPKSPHLYFTVMRRRDGFYVQHINNVKPVRCDLKTP